MPYRCAIIFDLVIKTKKQ